MPTIINNPNEIELNAIRYPLGGDGQIHRSLASNFAPKQVIGDYSKDSDPNRSIWTFFSDQKGGGGVEDMDEARHANRSWFSTFNTDYPGYGSLGDLISAATLPTLPTITDGNMEVWTDANTLTNWTYSEDYAGNTLTQGTGANKYQGTYSAVLTTTNNGGSTTYNQILQSLSGWSNNFRGKLVRITVYAKCTLGSGGSASITIDDGVSTTSTAITAGTFTQSAVIRTLNASATKIDCILKCVSGTVTGSTLYVDQVEIAALGSTVSPACDFNSNSYCYSGSILLRIDNSTGSILLEGIFPDAITSVVASIGSCLYVFMGDSQSYYYITTAGVFTAAVGSDGAGGGTASAATKAIQYAGLLGKITSAGQSAFASVPNSATPTWTAKGLLDTGSLGTIQNLRTYTDTTGADQIYCATTKGLFVHDYTNAVWLNTALQLPQHADNGKGLVVANGALNYSAGLSIYEYKITDGALSIRNIGLDLDDGLPDEYVGSITGLVGGYKDDLYALVDASLVSASNYSSVHRFRDGAWRTMWVDGTANQTMNGGLATSTYAYRLWFGVGSGLDWMAVDRARRNPMKVAASTFAASGLYISPNFDAAWPAAKNALTVHALARGTSADETIAIKYRIDKTNVDLGTGWTTLYTLVATDSGVEKIVSLGSSAGVVYRTIQFRLDGVRAAGTTTNRPILVYAALEYERLITPKWSWAMVLDCSKEYNGNSASVLLDALITAAETQTLITFYWVSTAKYVRVASVQSTQLTGDNKVGQYLVTITEK